MKKLLHSRFTSNFKKQKLGVIAFCVFVFLSLLGIYAPLLISSKPVLIKWQGHYYFPLFRYLFYSGFYTKVVDLFFNAMMITLPLTILGMVLLRRVPRVKKIFLGIILLMQFSSLFLCKISVFKDPSGDKALRQERLDKMYFSRQDNTSLEDIEIFSEGFASWNFQLSYMSTYQKINLLVKEKLRKTQDEKLQNYKKLHSKDPEPLPTLYLISQQNIHNRIEQLEKKLALLKKSYSKNKREWEKVLVEYRPILFKFIKAKHEKEIALSSKKEGLEEIEKTYKIYLKEAEKFIPKLMKAKSSLQEYISLESRLKFVKDKTFWINKELNSLDILIKPILGTFHWEDDAGGGSSNFNSYVPWYNLTRLNNKDLLSSLIFGIRVSLLVGFGGVFIALLIGVPMGLISGYFGGKIDLIISRFIEIWETMPVFFMLLFIVFTLQVKSLIMDIVVLGIFGWTGLSRFIRAESLKAQSLPYVLAAKGLGFSDFNIIFSHVLPNVLSPVLALLPFSLMGMISSEAALAFLGLGEENTTSWGALMNEAMTVFPGETALLWPPAIMLSLLLIIIALIGDAIRDSMDSRIQT